MRLQRIRAGLSAAAALFLCSAALAQSAGICAKEDLQCRVTMLEARLDVLTQNAGAAGASNNVPTIAPGGAPVPTQYFVQRFCKVNCAAEAADECSKRGFAKGTPEDWDRPRSGAMTLTRVTCTK
jgi:hypothetical protein